MPEQSSPPPAEPVPAEPVRAESAPALAPAAPALYDPSQMWAVPPTLLPAPRRNRPWLRTALRWTTAVVVCAAVGTGTAFAVMAPRRTDIPGLKTPGDGRYVFPTLQLPALPKSAATTTAESAPTSSGASDDWRPHAADLRGLLLPAPSGAKPDSSYPGLHSWYGTSAFAESFTPSSGVATRLQDDGARHVAATAWTGPDGTRTEIYLVQFRSYSTAEDLYQYLCGLSPVVAPGTLVDPEYVLPDISGGTDYTARAADAQSGHPAARVTCLQNNEVAAVIVMTNPAKVNPVVSKQVASLEAELLQG